MSNFLLRQETLLDLMLSFIKRTRLWISPPIIITIEFLTFFLNKKEIVVISCNPLISGSKTSKKILPQLYHNFVLISCKQLLYYFHIDSVFFFLPLTIYYIKVVTKTKKKSYRLRFSLLQQMLQNMMIHTRFSKIISGLVNSQGS